MSKKTIKGITKIAVKGFKSIAEECAIDIRPLTILAGANSSGKSSIMQPLLMLKQTLEAPYDPGPLLIDGPNVQFTLADQFLSKLTNKKESGRFQIQIETFGPDLSIAVTTIFQKSLNEIEIVEMATEMKSSEHPSFPIHFVLYPEMSVEECKSLAAQNWISTYPDLPTEALEKLKSLVDPDSMSKDSDIVKRSRCFLRFETQEGDIGFDFAIPAKYNVFNSIHLPGLRGNPERIYKLTSTGPRYPGTFENYAASIIHKWQEMGDKRLKKVVDALHTLGLTWKIGTEKISDVGIELQVGRLPRGSNDDTDLVNIADVGFGVSQVLPVVVALTAAEEEQLVYLEQPELHLHPRAQVALAQVLADAAKRGVRVVTETHSSLLLLGVQTLVAEGKLSPDLVKLHWFTRREDGVTEVASADLDEAGAYGEWPEDFADVSLHAQSGYIKAARSRFIEGR
ncbi:MAG: AAA family ATPase [Candidatus Poribacteria bacterium]|nr:AAA family ATPase [Candidatus Poribacteria bacterium]